MAKSKNEAIENRPDPQDELIALRAKVEQLEQEKKDSVSQDGTYIKEMEKLRSGKAQGLNEIQIKEIYPKTVSLWHVSGHNVGKRVGPVDATNAEYTFLVFAFFKIRLSLTKPTEEWIASYKLTDEYKLSVEKEQKRRAGKDKSKKTSETERLIEIMAKREGISTSQVVSIKDKNEVKGRI